MKNKNFIKLNNYIDKYVEYVVKYDKQEVILWHFVN
jgi:hypothetical protein